MYYLLEYWLYLTFRRGNVEFRGSTIASGCIYKFVANNFSIFYSGLTKWISRQSGTHKPRREFRQTAHVCYHLTHNVEIQSLQSNNNKL